MLSRHARIALLSARAAKKYSGAILETAALLQELIALVKAIDPLPKRVSWPPRLLAHLAARQHGICPACKKPLRREAVHVDHVVPWAQGGDNTHGNIRLLHARCNLLKSDGCNPDDVIRHLESRLLNLRSPTRPLN